jgi:hypothetical protein
MEIIYKFLPAERLSYLNDEFLRVTQPGDLNDPFECLPIPPTTEEIVSIINKVIDQKIIDLKGTKKQKEAHRKTLVASFQREIDDVRKNKEVNFKTKFITTSTKAVNDSMGLISFSRRWNSSLMWAHYANSHKGFCIGFNSTAEFFSKHRNLDESPIIFHSVEYSNNRIKVPLLKGEQVDPRVMLTKSKDWEYEDEERLLVSLHLTDKVIPSFPFDIFLLKVPHLLIKEIILGRNINEEHAEKLISFGRKHSIDIYRATISEERFDMERHII